MSVCSTLNWKLDMFVFEEMGKLEYMGREPTYKLKPHTYMVSTLGLEPRILW